MKRRVSWHFDLTLDYDARFWLGPMALAMLLCSAGDLASESVTLTTYYPAPSGVYSQLITTGNTYLARDAASNGGKVGVGTTAPGALMTIVNTDNTTNNILQVYPQNLTQGVAVGYNYIREIGSNGNNAMLIDAQGGAALALQTVSGGSVGIGTTGPGSTLDVRGVTQVTDDGAVPDTHEYASFGVTRANVAANDSYVGFTKQGVIPWGVGIGGGNGLIFGVAAANKTIPTPLLTVEGSGADTWGNLGVAGEPPGGEAYMYVNASGGNGSSCYYTAVNNGSCNAGMYITWVPGIYVDNGAWWYTGPNLNFSTVLTPLGNQTNITTTAPVYSCCWK